jgi:hypothetical protein
MFDYQGHERVVIPSAHGAHVDSRNHVLRGYQVGGFSNSRRPPMWSLFRIDDIERLTITDEHFAENPPGFRLRDKQIVIHCELDLV